MVDDFMVCVDRLIATACFESTSSGNGVGSRDHTVRLVGTEATKSECDGGCVKSNGGGGEGCSSKKKMVTDMVECRICQEEDDAHAMEAPCACNGTLKFAHRKCIQKWCNKKGNITCEICNQVFSPNYSLPLARSNTDVIAIDIRQAWAQHMDLHDSHLLALAAAERHLLQSEYDDFSLANTASIARLRSVALILQIIVLLRQVLMIIRDTGMVQESSTFFNVSLLQFAGFLLPCYVMARSCYTMQIRRRRQG